MSESPFESSSCSKVDSAANHKHQSNNPHNKLLSGEIERESKEISSMADSDADRPLRKISTAFKELAVIVNSPSPEVPVAQFSHACSLVSPLFGCLGIAFKFAEMDYVAKVCLSSWESW